MAVVKRHALALINLIIKPAKFSFLESQPPVIAFTDIADGRKGTYVVSGAPNNANLCTRGVRGVASNDVDCSQKGINAIGG